ncbi:MAG: DUF805 domain-containing protein [Jejuia sp.]
MPKQENNIAYYLRKAFYIDYWNFNGRSRGKEFWSVIILQALVLGFSLILHYFYFSFKGEFYLRFIFYLLVFIYFMLTTVPTITVHVRRLHDAGKSGWWHPAGISFMFNIVIGMVSLIVLFIYGLIMLLFFDGNPTFDPSVIDTLKEIFSYAVAVTWSLSVLTGITFLYLNSASGSNKWGENPKENPDLKEIENIGSK